MEGRFASFLVCLVHSDTPWLILEEVPRALTAVGRFKTNSAVEKSHFSLECASTYLIRNPWTASSLIVERLDTSVAKTPDSTERQLGGIHKKARDLITFLRVPHTNVGSFGYSATIRLSESFAFYYGRYAKGNDFVSSTPLPSTSPRAPRELYRLNIYY
ncbi:hypothetical protein CEXT_699411 [Caerostris extrusa]|uniref:Uncharacterized protein n=1 Tax=Caerostris extrusa TaxID=172846 RepID=A0AAV4W482_CAEEX|nr:hypothetical protein CEXT_699411 [Caerostris extrusa]